MTKTVILISFSKKKYKFYSLIEIRQNMITKRVLLIFYFIFIKSRRKTDSPICHAQNQQEEFYRQLKVEAYNIRRASACLFYIVTYRNGTVAKSKNITLHRNQNSSLFQIFNHKMMIILSKLHLEEKYNRVSVVLTKFQTRASLIRKMIDQ